MIQVQNTYFVFSEQNFQKVIEYAPVGIVIIDRDLNWQMINQKFCDITGYSVEELEHKTFLDITYPEDVNMNLNLYNQMLQGSYDEYFYEKRYVRKDGRVIWVKLSVAAVYLQGEYSHMVVSVEDIDENKKYRQAIEKANRELDLLLYKASHDLKSPIASLDGLKNLLSIENPEITGSETFRHLEHTIDKLKRQNESLLSLTQINDHNLLYTEINLEKFLSGISGNINGAGITDFSGIREVKVKSDPFLMTVLFKNLLENSIQFNHNKKPRIRISYENRDGKSIYYVRDNGQGIDDEIREKIFEMFYKGSERSAGSGLGLFLVKKAVEKLNGEIQVESIKNSGTIFRIALPDQNIPGYFQ